MAKLVRFICDMCYSEGKIKEATCIYRNLQKSWAACKEHKELITEKGAKVKNLCKEDRHWIIFHDDRPPHMDWPRKKEKEEKDEGKIIRDRVREKILKKAAQNEKIFAKDTLEEFSKAELIELILDYIKVQGTIQKMVKDYISTKEGIPNLNKMN